MYITMYIFGDLFTCVIWFNCHTLIINKHLNTRCLQFFSHFQIHQHIPIFLFSPIMTFGASCRCLCSFHLGFLPTPSFRSPPPPDSRLFLMGPFWSLLNIMSLFSMLFPFFGFPAVLLCNPFPLGVFHIQSFLWSRAYSSSSLRGT